MNHLKGTLTISAAGALAVLLATSTGALGQESAAGGSAPSVGAPLRPFAADPGGAVTAPVLEDGAASGGADLAAEELRLLLSDGDLDRRMEAFDRASREAVAGSEARAALETLAKDLGDPDVAFLARLALRQGPTPTRIRGLGAFASPFGGPMGADVFGIDPFGGDPFRELDQRMKELHERLRSGQLHRLPWGPGGAPHAGPGPGAAPMAPGATFSSSSVSISEGPDGVRVELTEDQGQGREVFTYEAESMDALLKAHPELRAKLGR